jgi:hypothetical protein
MRIAAALALSFAGSTAYGQVVDRRYAEEPTGGVALPATPLAGDHDARAVSVNPGGLTFLNGPELLLALDLETSDVATSSGPGFAPCRGPLAASDPEARLGFGTKTTRPSRAALPDPGSRIASRCQRHRAHQNAALASRGTTSSATGRCTA